LPETATKLPEKATDFVAVFGNNLLPFSTTVLGNNFVAWCGQAINYNDDDD